MRRLLYWRWFRLEEGMPRALKTSPVLGFMVKVDGGPDADAIFAKDEENALSPCQFSTSSLPVCNPTCSLIKPKSSDSDRCIPLAKLSRSFRMAACNAALVFLSTIAPKYCALWWYVPDTASGTVWRVGPAFDVSTCPPLLVIILLAWNI